MNPRPPLPDRGGRVPRRSDVHCASAHDHRTGRPRCVPLPAHRCLGTPLRDLAVNRQCLGRYVDRPEPNPAAAACSLSLSMRIREMCLGMVLLDGASVSDPYCDQNDRKDHRDEEALHDSYSRTELAVIWHGLSSTNVMAVTKEWNSASARPRSARVGTRFPSGSGG